MNEDGTLRPGFVASVSAVCALVFEIMLGLKYGLLAEVLGSLLITAGMGFGAAIMVATEQDEEDG